MNRRRLLIAQSSPSPDLPSGYTRLNYLESEGEGGNYTIAQYIDTGIVPLTYGGVGVQISNFSFVRHAPKDFSWNVAFGSSDNYMNGANAFAMWLRDDNGTWGMGCGTDRMIYSETPIVIGQTYSIEAGVNSDSAFLKLDNNTIFDFDFGLGTPSHNSLYLCGTNQGWPFASAIRFGETLITGAPITSGTLNGAQVLRHFIPALDRNGQPCLYDLVTEQPFYRSYIGEEYANREFLYG